MHQCSKLAKISNFARPTAEIICDLASAGIMKLCHCMRLPDFFLDLATFRSSAPSASQKISDSYKAGVFVKCIERILSMVRSLLELIASTCAQFPTLLASNRDHPKGNSVSEWTNALLSLAQFAPSKLGSGGQRTWLGRRTTDLFLLCEAHILKVLRAFWNVKTRAEIPAESLPDKVAMELTVALRLQMRVHPPVHTTKSHVIGDLQRGLGEATAAPSSHSLAAAGLVGFTPHWKVPNLRSSPACASRRKSTSRHSCLVFSQKNPSARYLVGWLLGKFSVAQVTDNAGKRFCP